MDGPCLPLRPHPKSRCTLGGGYSWARVSSGGVRSRAPVNGTGDQDRSANGETASVLAGPCGARCFGWGVGGVPDPPPTLLLWTFIVPCRPQRPAQPSTTSSHVHSHSHTRTHTHTHANHPPARARTPTRPHPPIHPCTLPSPTPTPNHSTRPTTATHPPPPPHTHTNPHLQTGPPSLFIPSTRTHARTPPHTHTGCAGHGADGRNVGRQR